MKVGSNLYLTGKDILGATYGIQSVDAIPRVPDHH